MDALAFRILARELENRLTGMRLEKVFTPLPGIWTFTLGRVGNVILHTGKPVPFLILSSQKPDNPSNPSGPAMWLRKRLRGRRVTGMQSDWPRRRLALGLSPGEGRWLVLDMQAGPSVVDNLPDGFGATPWWPDVDEVRSGFVSWKEHPHLTPPLRRRLASLDRDAACELLRSLREDEPRDCYLVSDHRGQPQVRLWAEGASPVRYSNVVEATERAYGQCLAALIGNGDGAEQAVNRELRRLERALVRLGEDRARLEAMIREADDALLVQAHLHALDKNTRVPFVRVPGVDGELKTVALRPGLTVRENMERIFARSAKGRRGLPLVAEREAGLRRDAEAVRAGRVVPGAGRGNGGGDPASNTRLPAKYRSLKVGVYRSSDGFFLVRGRSAQANHQLLQIASPFDYWLHAQDGPGAHVIIKRDFPKQGVPETTIQEAATLAALASHLKMADRGDVLLCLVRDVRAVKDAGLGQVAVDTVLRVVRPRIEPDLEARLRL